MQLQEISEIHIGNEPFDRTVTVFFNNKESTTFDWVFLRDNCTCPQCFHNETKQRIFDTFNQLPFLMERNKDGTVTYTNDMPQDVSFKIDSDSLMVTWQDGHISKFSSEWLYSHSYAPSLQHKRLELPVKVYWDAKDFKDLSQDRFNVKYSALTEKHTGSLLTVLKEIHTYGFTFVHDVPVSLEATQKVSELISIIRPTHYDLGVWDFTSDLSKKDTAYTSLAIDMHTDGNYWYELPGLQLFHMLEHSNGSGGETRIVDVAKIVDVLFSLAKSSPSWETTYKVLTQQPIKFHQAGEVDNCFTQQSYPTLSLDSQGRLVQCRWNTSDRSSMIPDAPGTFTKSQVYEALYRFNALINDPEYFVQFQLSPGTILVFDNWRVLHARTEFTGRRRLCGSYLTRDDYLARLRSMSFEREELLNSM